MKTFTKVSLFMLAMVISTSFLFAQNMNIEGDADYQQLMIEKEAALGPVTYDHSGTRAVGDACTDPIFYGNINDAPQTGSIASYGEVWYSFTGADDMSVTVSLCNSDFDTKVEVWWACTDGGYAFYNDDACGSMSEISGIPFTGGSTHYVKVYGYSSASGNYELEITGVPLSVNTFPYVQNFDASTSIPDAWVNTSSDPWKFGSSCTYGASEDHTTGSGYFAWVDDSTPYDNPSDLLSPFFDLTVITADGRIPYLDFYYWIGRGTTTSSLNIDIYDGGTWHLNVGTYGYHNGWIGASINLTPYVSTETQIRFRGIESTSGYDCDISLDDVSVYGVAYGDVNGYVYNDAGLPVPNATVGIEALSAVTTTDATGYYELLNVDASTQDISAFREGYNLITHTITIPVGGVVTRDFTLTQPSIIINPLFFDEVLNPDEYLTKYLGFLNTGSGPGDWTATINYISKNPNVVEVTGQPYPQTSSRSGESELLTTKAGDPFYPEDSRDLFECNAGSLFGNSPVGSSNASWSQYGGSYQQYQQVNGVSGSWTTVTFWGVYLSGTPTTEDFFIGVYQDNGSTYGSEIASYVVTLDPITTGELLLGSYPIYQYIATIPSQSVGDFWISCQATSQMYWLWSDSGTGNSSADSPFAVCIEGGGVVGGWLSLSEYEGTVPGNGTSQNIEVNFDATGTSPGDVYNAEIVIETAPNVGTFTIPVTMTIYGDPLSPVTNLEATLEMASGAVELTWEFNTDVTFQYFKIKRNGLQIATTTDLFYTDQLLDFGTYCYTVAPVFDEGSGAPAGPECVDWLIPALCWSPASLYNEQWPDSQEEVILTLENCGDGVLNFVIP